MSPERDRGDGGWRGRRWRQWQQWQQWRQPAAFRIPAPGWDAATRARLTAVLDEVSAVPADTAGVERLDDAALAAAATNLWRARRRLEHTDGGAREARQLQRLLRSAQEALGEAGVTLQDHDGTAFDSGFSLEVLAFEPDASVSVETVRETLRPCIYLGERRIQMAQVIVGQPVDGATSGG